MPDDSLAGWPMRASFMWQSLGDPDAAQFRTVLECARKIRADEENIPGLGFLADVISTLRAIGQDLPVLRRTAAPGFPDTTRFAYEDHVLSRLSADPVARRCARAIEFHPSIDVDALSEVVKRLCHQTAWPCHNVPIRVLREWIDQSSEWHMRCGWLELQTPAAQDALEATYAAGIAGFRDAPRLFSEIDVLELEHGLGAIELGQRVALNQIIRLTRELSRGATGVPCGRRGDAVVCDESAVGHLAAGGFSSITTQGRFESLLQSQLVFMDEAGLRPDLFDIKYVKNDLLYYSRDDNAFARRKRELVWQFDPDLAQARIKQPDAPFQLIVFVMALVCAVSRRVITELGHEGLLIEILIPEELDDERQLFKVLLADWLGESVRLHHSDSRADQVEAGDSVYERDIVRISAHSNRQSAQEPSRAVRPPARYWHLAANQQQAVLDHWCDTQPRHEVHRCSVDVVQWQQLAQVMVHGFVS